MGINTNNREDAFHYSYSAKQQAEIEKIKSKYVEKELDKMEQLRKLDQSAEQPGTIAAIAAGVIGSLILGVGMCCTMVWKDFFVLGIVVGIIGMAILGCAYPLYKKMTKKRRAQIAPQILKLTAELQ